MINSIKILEWDSNLFGYQVASLDIPNNDELESFYLKQSLHDNRISLLYIFTDPSDNNNMKIIEALGAYKVDERQLFYKDKILKDSEIIPDIEPYKYEYVNRNLYSLTLQSGEFSRFNIDKHFRNNEYIKLYSKWIERSVKKEIANEILVYLNSSEEYGMITLNVKAEIGTIGLFAVDKAIRGKSIGKKLIKSAERYFLDHGVKEIYVTTQGDNISACQFYKSCGFKIKNRKNVYHLWL